MNEDTDVERIFLKSFIGLVAFYYAMVHQPLELDEDNSKCWISHQNHAYPQKG